MSEIENFRIESYIDGKDPLMEKTRAADGGFELLIYQRDKGDIIRAATIMGYEMDGHLTLAVNVDGKQITIKTER